jgi:hypothetical protein
MLSGGTIIMRWTTPRVTIFFFSLVLGIAVTSVLAQRFGEASIAQNYRRTAQAVRDAEPPAPPEQDESYQASVSFEPLEIVSGGYTNTEIVTLREGPHANSTINAVLKPQNEYVEILGATRDYLHVRFLAADASVEEKGRDKDLTGWVAWGEVVPSVTAIVLDAETGQIVSRLPFADNETSPFSISFSADNSRAIIYGNPHAYEVNAEDYTLTRSFTTQIKTNASHASIVPSFFYGSTGDTLYAALHQINSQPANESLLDILRVHGPNETPGPPEISEQSTGFALSPDSRRGFILHSAKVETTEDGTEKEMLIDVLDLRGMRVSNTLKLRGENVPVSASEIVTSMDGSKLYANLFPSREVISVIETNTGRLLGEIPTGALKGEAQYPTQDELVGDSWLFRIWADDAHESYSVWLDGGKTSRAARGIDYAVEAVGARWAVNHSGTRLFKLDEHNRISEKHWIDRPDVRLQPGNAEGLGVYNLFASPDGKRLILILGTIDAC